MRSERFRFFVLTCRNPKTDFRLPLVDALRRDYDVYYIWLRRRPIVSGPGNDSPSREMSLMAFFGFVRGIRQDDRINVYLNSTNTYFPGMTAVLRLLSASGVWCFDMHDELRYHNTGFKRWREGKVISFLQRISHVTVHAAPTLQELFPRSRHLGNASNILPLKLNDQGDNSVLIIASFDERFDFDFVAKLAQLCPERRFDLHGWTRPDDSATMVRITALAANHTNVRYHGAYAMADLPGILSAYRVSVAPYQANSGLTRYIDPLRYYHCLNAGLEVISTDIPQAQFLGDCIHIVPDAASCARTLAAIQAGESAKQLNYSPITWEQRADRLVEIIRDETRTMALARR